MHRRLELDRAIGRASRSSKSGYDHSDSVPDPQNKARVQNAQTAFDHQQCVTKQACYTVEKEKKRMIVAFLRFIECQLVYMRRCAAISEAVKANLIKYEYLDFGITRPMSISLILDLEGRHNKVAERKKTKYNMVFGSLARSQNSLRLLRARDLSRADLTLNVL